MLVRKIETDSVLWAAVDYQVLIISTIYDCYIDLAAISILAATQQGAIVNQY